MSFIIRTRLLIVLIAASTSLASPIVLDGRQTSSSSPLLSCAAAPLRIDQFTTFSGTKDESAYVTFFLTNENVGAPTQMLCTASFAAVEHVNFNSSSFYSCAQPGSGFNYKSSGSTLSIFQYMDCASEAIDSSSDQIVITASGSIETYSYPGVNGGQHSESITGSISIPINAAQNVDSSNGSAAGGSVSGSGGDGLTATTGTMEFQSNYDDDNEEEPQHLKPQNVTCGFVGENNIIYTVGKCDLANPGLGIIGVSGGL